MALVSRSFGLYDWWVKLPTYRAQLSHFAPSLPIYESKAQIATSTEGLSQPRNSLVMSRRCTLVYRRDFTLPSSFISRVRNRDRGRNWEKGHRATEPSGLTLRPKQWRVFDFWARSPQLFICFRRRMEAELSPPCNPRDREPWRWLRLSENGATPLWSGRTLFVRTFQLCHKLWNLRPSVRVRVIKW